MKHHNSLKVLGALNVDHSLLSDMALSRGGLVSGDNCKVVVRGGSLEDVRAKSTTSDLDQGIQSYQQKVRHGVEQLKRTRSAFRLDELNGQFSFLRQFTWNNELRTLMTEEIVDLRRERMSLIAELEMMREENVRLRCQLSHAKNAQERLDVANEHKMRLMGDLKDLHQEREVLRCELARSREIYSRLQEVNGDKLRMNRKLGEMMDINDHLQNELVKVREENRKLIEMVEDANEDRNEMRISLEHATLDCQRVRRELESAQSENARLWERLQQAHEHQEKMTDELLATAATFGTTKYKSETLPQETKNT